MIKNGESYDDDFRKSIVLEHLRDGISYRKLCQKYSISQNALTRWRRQFEPVLRHKEGYLPPSHLVSGTSTLYDNDGSLKMQWIKTTVADEEKEERFKAFIDGLIKNVEPIPPLKNKPKGALASLLSTYIISDFHLGQYSSLSETGDEWNIDIAKKTLKSWIDMAIAVTPKSEQAILCDLGDFLHADGLSPLTPASKHVLDASGRFHEAIDAAIECFDYMILRLLEHHDRVHVIICEGNHNESSAHWMTRAISRKYEKQSRLTFDMSDKIYYAYKWGDVSLFFHHGHKRNINDISNTLISMFRELYGSTKYSYAHVGHFHHKASKDNGSMEVFQHYTLAGKDAFSARGGYLSKRGASVTTYHKNGNLSTTTNIGFDMLDV